MEEDYSKFLARARDAYAALSGMPPFETLDLGRLREMVGKADVFKSEVRVRHTAWSAAGYGRGYRVATGMDADIENEDEDHRAWGKVVRMSPKAEIRMARAITGKRGFSVNGRTFWSVKAPLQQNGKCGLCQQSVTNFTWTRHLDCWVKYGG